MDPNVMQMNNLRVLNDYLTQTLDALNRQSRFAQGSYGFSPFGGIPATAGALGTDTVWGSWFGSPMLGATPFAGVGAFAPWGGADPFFAQRALGGGALAGWPQGWSPMHEVTRQAQLTQALAAKQSVLEAMCRCCGIPV